MNLTVQFGVLAALAAVPSTYRLEILPVPVGCNSYYSIGHGLAETGAAIGNVQCGASPDFRAVAWDDSGLRELPTLIGTGSYAFGISRDGSTILGMAQNGETGSEGQFVWLPVRWEDGTLVTLPTLGGPFGAATDMDQRVAVIGASQTDAIDPRVGREALRASIWVDGVPNDLGDLGGPDAEALAMNRRGWIVGWADGEIAMPQGDGYFHVAFLHDGSGMTSLGTLGGDWSEAVAINQAGEIVGSSETLHNPNTGRGETHAFSCARGAMRDIGSLSGHNAVAWDINDRGDIVGTCRVPVPGERGKDVATLWRGAMITDLNELVGHRDGWELREATAIDNRGSILVQAYRAGEFRLGILHPQQP